jgi:hypothetical protein
MHHNLLQIFFFFFFFLPELLSETDRCKVRATENDLKTGLQTFTVVAVAMNILIVHSKLLLHTYNPTHFSSSPMPVCI